MMNQSFKETYLKRITKTGDNFPLYIYTSIDKADTIFFLEEDQSLIKVGDRFNLDGSLIEIKSIDAKPIERIIERDEKRIIKVVCATYQKK